MTPPRVTLPGIRPAGAPTPLGRLLGDRIRTAGPMTLAAFMEECLLHPRHGYYVTRDPLGRAGDFVTSPEISQMFGELLGLALAQAWLDRGAPAPFVLAELGPGRGTLMADALRATRGVPGFHDAMRLHLVEASPVLRDTQVRTLARPVTHVAHEGELPPGPLFLVANEFFDALPVRQFHRHGPAWRERLVGLDGDRLTFGLSEPTLPGFLTHRLDDTADGDVVEYSPRSDAIASALGRRLEAEGGVALIVDYGGWHSLGDTFQAVRDHAPVPPLVSPGEADLTAHVDFEALARAARPAAATGMATQGEFLERLGLTPRAEALARGLSGAALESHRAAYRRLTHPAEMGTLFKVMALYQTASPPPPGFDTCPSKS